MEQEGSGGEDEGLQVKEGKDRLAWWNSTDGMNERNRKGRDSGKEGTEGKGRRDGLVGGTTL